MKVGDYVRTNRGIIAKIIKVNSTGSITCDRSVYYGFNVVNSKRILKDFSSIVKSSSNIIDLIEVGDYVNGEKVIRLFNPTFLSMGELPYVITDKNSYEPQEIESIVTKKQFENMEYKVGE